MTYMVEALGRSVTDVMLIQALKKLRLMRAWEDKPLFSDSHFSDSHFSDNHFEAQQSSLNDRFLIQYNKKYYSEKLIYFFLIVFDG